jgi:uridine kinase
MTRGASVTNSVSTWQQPVPRAASSERDAMLDVLAETIAACGEHRLRIAIDGLTAAGKTSLGHEVAQRLASRGRPVFRASLDDFKRPWSEAHLYDRISGEGYYRNAFDYDAVRTLLLEPSAPTRDGRVALCSIDPITQVDHSGEMVTMAPNGILIVDGVFACRPEINTYWDRRVWVDIDAETSIRRGVERDTEMEGGTESDAALHRDRYLASELVYLAEVDPRAKASIIVDNTDFARPRIVRPAS